MAVVLWIFSLDHHTPILPIWRSTVSKLVVEVDEVALERRLVSPSVQLYIHILTLSGRVAAGAIAEKYLSLAHGVEIVSFVASVGSEHLFPPTAEHPTPSTNPDFLSLIDTISREKVDSFAPVRCPDSAASQRMTKVIEKYRDAKDSIGGTLYCVIRNCPIGLGEPCFDKLTATLAHAMLSIPATKGFEIGSGFGGCEVPGSIHNDPFIQEEVNGKKKLTTKTNNSGGIQGGISNGAPIYFRVAFKPPATIGQAQQTVNYEGEAGVLEAKGRHDPCVVPRAVPIVEAMAALVIIDALMAQKARESTRSLLPSLKATLPARGTGTEATPESVQQHLNGSA